MEAESQPAEPTIQVGEQTWYKDGVKPPVERETDKSRPTGPAEPKENNQAELEQILVTWGQACVHGFGGELQKRIALAAITEIIERKVEEARRSHE